VIIHGSISGAWAKGLCFESITLTCCQCSSQHLTCWCCTGKRLSKNSTPPPLIHLLRFLEHDMRFLFRREGQLALGRNLKFVYCRSFISLCFCLGLCIAVSLRISRQSLLRLDHLQRFFSWAQSTFSRDQTNL